MSELSPTEIAEFDQGYAQSMDMLVELVGSYRYVCQIEDDVPEQLRIVALARHLINEWDMLQLSSALAMAVVCLNRAMPEQPCDDCEDPMCTVMRSS